MRKAIEKTIAPKPDALFGRVVSTLEQARGNVVRASCNWNGRSTVSTMSASWPIAANTGLPTEEQLRLEIERERHLIESALEDRAGE